MKHTPLARVALDVYVDRWDRARHAWSSLHMWRARADGTRYVAAPPYVATEDDYRESLIAVLSAAYPQWLAPQRPPLAVIHELPMSASEETRTACADADLVTWITCKEVIQYPWRAPVIDLIPATRAQLDWYTRLGTLPAVDIVDDPGPVDLDYEILLTRTPEDLWGVPWLTKALEFLAYASEVDARVTFCFRGAVDAHR